ncbi:hypothetical protein B0T25DRAFT_572348 [Lasiosphaeria hispida]|uniref:Retrovirus-related Pol polyprotein from transposon TNT 1-94-like beta-barrel domain-containing protein n=1 Tax=Lasiosphaeria hispida TaxID=260671 RepID=A0AAJ0HCZ6_9PEZI|nr:hypothetical protein B0T25DRAFT_572348 [Lasiosphaeria hispida]
MSATTSAPGLCPDWIFSSASDVHVAADRAWFASYTPFETYTTSYLSGSRMQSVGIGDVELPVRVHPKRHGSRAHGTLHLHNVLHVPTSNCNILGGPGTGGDFMASFSLGSMDDGTTGHISDANGRRIAYFYKVCGLYAVKLSGPPVGPVLAPSRLQKDCHYMIQAFWPDTERERWAAIQSGQNDPKSAPYTDKEKEWLKEHFDGEFHFLQMYGLSIFKDEDREEGKQIARTMMTLDAGDHQHDQENKRDVDSSESDDNESAAESDDFQDHMVDYLFTEAQLEFIEKGWGDALTFMYAFGLKFYDNDDCEEAKSLIRGLMAPQDDDSD